MEKRFEPVRQAEPRRTFDGYMAAARQAVEENKTGDSTKLNSLFAGIINVIRTSPRELTVEQFDWALQIAGDHGRFDEVAQLIIGALPPHTFVNPEIVELIKGSHQYKLAYQPVPYGSSPVTDIPKAYLSIPDAIAERNVLKNPFFKI